MHRFKLPADSALRNLPTSVSRKQGLFFDGIRFSALMAAHAYERLLGTLHEIATERRERTLEATERLVVSSLADGWAIIDSLHRLRQLVQQLPGMKQRDPATRAFYDGTAAATTLRNFVQHINKEVTTLASTGYPLLGVINWTSVVDPRTGKGLVCTLVSGTVRTATYTVEMPWDKAMQGEVGFVTLSAGGTTVALAELLGHAGNVIQSFDAQLQRIPGANVRNQADLVFYVDVDATKADGSEHDRPPTGA